MDDNIHNLRDALEWLDRRIREEVEYDGEMTNEHAIELAFIQSMLAKFPLRQCDVGTAEEQERARNRETVADTVAEMRDAANSADAWRAGVAANVVMDFADRVETAARRERDHAVEHATRHAECVARDNCRDCVHNPRGKNYEGGNAAAMREALDYLCERMADMDATFDPSEVECLRAALAAPPRNCDVGTPEEQTRRMYAQVCSRQRSCYELPSGEHCPLHCTGVDCRLAWSQMSYKAQAQEGGAK